MNATELRIGNIFLIEPIGAIKSEPVPTPIKDIRLYYGQYLINSFMWDQGSLVGHGLDQIHPISLTEEWLLRMGFIVGDEIFLNTISLTNAGGGDMHGSKQFRKADATATVYVKDGHFFYELGFVGTEFTNEIPAKQVEFVHQLQNLYHALTGEELPLTPASSESPQPR